MVNGLLICLRREQGGGYVHNYLTSSLRRDVGRVRKSSSAATETDSMKPDPRLFEDLTRMAGGAMNLFSALREQILGDVKARMDDMAVRLDLVPREDFERLEAQVKELRKQLDALKPAKAATAKPAATAPKKKTPAKKPATKKKPGKR